MSTFRTCPDCGGLLAPTRPEWLSTIDLASGRQPQEGGPVVSQCLICGYEEPVRDPDGPLEVSPST